MPFDDRLVLFHSLREVDVEFIQGEPREIFPHPVNHAAKRYILSDFAPVFAQCCLVCSKKTLQKLVTFEIPLKQPPILPCQMLCNRRYVGWYSGGATITRRYPRTQLCFVNLDDDEVPNAVARMSRSSIQAHAGRSTCGIQIGRKSFECRPRLFFGAPLKSFQRRQAGIVVSSKTLKE